MEITPLIIRDSGALDYILSRCPESFRAKVIPFPELGEVLFAQWGNETCSVRFVVRNGKKTLAWCQHIGEGEDMKVRPVRQLLDLWGYTPHEQDLVISYAKLDVATAQA